MGAKESKQFPITYDEASKRVSETEKRRLQDAFRRSSATNSNLSKQVFIQDVLGECVPGGLSDQIFSLVGGGRGVSFRELLTLLVLVTRGTREEKFKFIYGILAVESGAFIERGDMTRFILDCDGGSGSGSNLPVSLSTLFTEGDRASFEQFTVWLEKNNQDLGLARWILSPNSNLSLVSHLDTPTFYQTLAGVTHLSEQEIMELEKKFWSLVGNSNSGRIDPSIITPLVSPPLPQKLVTGLFKAFDENQDGHVDFKELACGVSAACRGPDMERQKFCFKMYDLDGDGKLNEAEIRRMVESMIEVASQTKTDTEIQQYNSEKLVSDLLKMNNDTSKHVTLEEFLVWTVDNVLAREMGNLIVQLCHVCLGLRPSSRAEEGHVVRGWLAREERGGLVPGQVWYLVPMSWWTHWHNYVNWCASIDPVTKSPGGTLTKKKTSVSSSLASDTCSRVVGTGYTQLSEQDSRPVTPVTRTQSSNSSTSTDSPITPRKHGSNASSRPGLIDTSGLIQSSQYRGITVLTGEGGKLKNSGKLLRGREYELVPERLWKFLVQMYGGSPALPRQVIRNKNGKVELELNPLSTRILKHQTIARQPNVPTLVGGYSAAALQAGVGGGTYHHGFSGNGGGAGVGPPSVTRRYHAYQAAFSKRTAIGQIDEFLCGRLHVKHEDLRLWLYKGDSDTTMKMLDQENITLEDVGFQDDDAILAEIRSRDGTWPEEISSLCGDKKIESDRHPLVAGVTGLNNLGNTCYMNAALQVVSSTKILAEYFKTNCHLYELNRTNPLGMKGHIAKRYGDLVRDMWAGETRTIAPIKLRWTIGKYQACFSSFQQQDSQEFLAFLLDGLHEDLNRVTDKPYVELKDSDGRPDVQVAAEAWDNHILRNKSIIVDLFHGQLKSKVTCKVCGHESVRCDPFFTLSLPLPMERCVSVEVVVILQEGSTPIKYGLTLDMEDKCSVIPPKLARVCGVPPSNLVLVDIIQSQIRVISSHEQKVRNLNGSCIYAYEVPRSPEGNSNNVNVVASSQVGPAPVVTNVNSVPGGQSITDIQRAAHSRVKGKNGSLVGVGDDADPEGEEVSSCPGSTHPPRASWSKHCMSGITLCFKPSNNNNNNKCDPSPDSLAPDRTDPDPSRPPSSSDSASLLPPSSSTPPSPHSPSSPTLLTEPQKRHSRASSASSTLTAGTLDSDKCPSSCCPLDLGDASQGVIVCLHRKMMPQEFYFLSGEKYSPSLFGIPLVVNLISGVTTCQDVYRQVWVQVARLVSPLPPQEQAHSSNHAQDCDDSLGYEYPFVLKSVTSGGCWCATCPWDRMCRGCSLPCTNTCLTSPSSFFAIDWDPTALHLRYLAAQERAWVEHDTVAASRRAATEPITLAKCLEAFTQEEELGHDDKIYCASCKTHQMVTKKLQIWRLPPILIIHLKRFQNVNSRWIKSHKIVDFPLTQLDPTGYLAAVPAATLTRHKELLAAGFGTKVRSSIRSNYNIIQTIQENSEPNSIVNTNADDIQDDPVHVGDVDLSLDEDPNDSGIESNGGNGHGRLDRGVSVSSDVFDHESDNIQVLDTRKVSDNSSNRDKQPRTRQISTSLVKDPVLDDNLKDFHQHHLADNRDNLDVKYNMYAMVCHSGVLGGGHYVSYSRTNENKWYCHNDSACKEVPETNIDKSSAYILMYEREGLSLTDYMPDTRGLKKDSGDLDEEFDNDFKKQCSIM